MRHRFAAAARLDRTLREPSRPSRLRPATLAAILAGAALLAPAAALAGGIAGTVRGPGGAPLSDIAVVAYSSTVGNPLGAVRTGLDGTYLLATLAAGSYFVQVEPPFPNPQRYTGMTYTGIVSNTICGARGTEVLVGRGITSGIDFAIPVGATIRGRVTEAGSGAPVASAAVSAFDMRGCDLGTFGVDAAGAYELTGLPPGRYYLLAATNGERAATLFPAIPCWRAQCDIFQGTLVSTGSTSADFVLPAGCSIAGTITSSGGAPVNVAEVQIWKDAQRVGTLFSDVNGRYAAAGLAAGTGYRVLAKKPGLVAEVHPNAACPNGTCNVSGTGTAFDLPAPGSAVTGKDIQLAPGYSIIGSLSPVEPGRVQVFGVGGLAGAVATGPSYTVPDLPNGNYVVKVAMRNRITELWNNHPCPANQICLPDEVTISGANRTGINFTLGLAHSIRGTVRNPGGDPVGGVPVEVWSADGFLMSTGTTRVDGTYVTDSEGLPAGTYHVRTRLPRRIHQYLDRVWPDRPCGASCLPTTGEPVTLNGSADTIGIDFVLPMSGLAFFTLTPCRLFDSRSGSSIASGVLVALRVEGACGIPGNAYAVAANVTVTSASAGGSLTAWPANLPAQPPTWTISIRAGVTRANNAVLPLSLEGQQNLALRGALPGGRYHLIIDVVGYFATATPP
jgi:hypothetical protein